MTKVFSAEEGTFIAQSLSADLGQLTQPIRLQLQNTLHQTAAG
jgi:hypothetical protein